MPSLAKSVIIFPFLMLLAGSQVNAAEPHYNVNDYYQVYKEGRIYVFDDYKTYAEFVELGETPFRLTRVGAGPQGETVVFGLRAMDKNLTSGIGSVDLYDGQAEGIKAGFYGEVIQNGRIYVFNEWEDLRSFIQVGEAPFRYTDIGAGPKGETVVYVLNSGNKQQKPTELMTEFKKKHKK